MARIGSLVWFPEFSRDQAEARLQASKSADAGAHAAQTLAVAVYNHYMRIAHEEQRRKLAADRAAAAVAGRVSAGAMLPTSIPMFRPARAHAPGVTSLRETG